jgi:hypothetical protein
MDGGIAADRTQPQQRGRIGALPVDQPRVGQTVMGAELLQSVREKKRIG